MHRSFGPLGPDFPYRDDRDVELASEIGADPFSEEPYSLPHRKRFTKKTDKNTSNQKKTEDQPDFT